MDDIALVAQWVRAAERMTVLTGAGISTGSGIPDFRGPDGIWTKDPTAERLSSLQSYMRDRDLRVRAWRLRREHPAWTALPNAAHRALVELERQGPLRTLITQNIDGLHQKAGSSADVVVEIHGTIHDVVCMSCGDRGPMHAALARVDAGEDDPDCVLCGGILKSATISFGQPLVAEDLERARAAAESSDLFLCVGTSLTVYPVAHLPRVAARSEARLVILNAEETALDGIAHLVIRGPVERLLPRLASPQTADDHRLPDGLS